MTRLYACIISPDIKRDRGFLVDVADKFASSIEVIEDGVLFDVSGLERLVGKPDRIARKIVGELKRRNVAGQVAVADTVDTAKLLARCKSPRTRTLEGSPLLTRGLSQQELAQQDMFGQLPLSGLDIERDTLNVFSELGLRTIKDLQAVPHDDLVGRYGQKFTRVIDVLEQRGRSLITPNVKENNVSWSYELNNPVEDFEQLIFLLNHGLERLFAEVKYAGFSTEHIFISLKCRSPRVSKGDTLTLDESPLLTRGLLQNGAATKTYDIKTSFPTLDRSFWLKLINLRAALDPPEDLISAVDAVAYFTKPRTDQRGLYAVSRPEPESLLLTVNKLKKLVGEENVGVPVLVNQRLARPFALDADSMPNVTGKVSDSNPSRLQRRAQSEENFSDELTIVAQAPGILGFDHFTPPLSAEVLVRDGRLVYIRTRSFAGHVTNFSGVWKGNSHWWDKPWKTQEWDIQIENGGVYRLCKANNEWFLTGEYD